MPPADLAAADPVSVVVARLRRPGDTRVRAELGLGPDDDASAHIGSRNVPPYPRLIISDPPGGSNRGLRWLMSPSVQVEAVGDLDGRPGEVPLPNGQPRYLSTVGVYLHPPQPQPEPVP
jgi:hypothetical protein